MMLQLKDIISSGEILFHNLIKPGIRSWLDAFANPVRWTYNMKAVDENYVYS